MSYRSLPLPQTEAGAAQVHRRLSAEPRAKPDSAFRRLAARLTGRPSRGPNGHGRLDRRRNAGLLG